MTAFQGFVLALILTVGVWILVIQANERTPITSQPATQMAR